MLVHVRVDLDRARVQPGLVRERARTDIRAVAVRGQVGDLVDGVRDPHQLAQFPGGQHRTPELGLQPGDHAEQVGVAAPLAVAVCRPLDVSDPGLDRDEGVRDRAGGVVVAVDTQARTGCVAHGGDNLADPGRQHAAVGVAEDDDLGTGIGGNPDHLQGVISIGPVAVEKMLGVDEHPLTFGTQMRHRVPDHRQVLGERGAQGPLNVPAVGFRDQADDVGSGVAQGCDLGVVGGCAPGTAGGAERGEGGVVQTELGSGAAEELGVLGVRPGPSALDETHANVVEVAGYGELVADRQ